VEFCEQRCIEMADILVSPSRYLIDWFVAQGFKLPKNSFVIKNLPPARWQEIGSKNSLPALSEIVFLGKQIELKGVTLFCDAIDSLKLGDEYRVTFLGRPAKVDFQNSLGYIGQRAASWNAKIQFLLEVNTDEILEYCTNSKRLIVIPSYMENSPYVVMECLQAACRFIASDVGGIPELIKHEDWNYTLFQPNTNSLAACILQYLKTPFSPPRPSYAKEYIEESWVTLHKSILSAERVLPEHVARRKVSVCIAHHNRPHLVLRAIESILFQQDVELEIVVVDDGSSEINMEALSFVREKVKFENIRWVFTSNEGLSHARNAAAEASTSDVLLFVDDDDIVLQGAIGEMLDVMNFTGADIVVGSYRAGLLTERGVSFNNSSSGPTFLGVGPALALSPLINTFGPSFALIKKDCWRAQGGFNTKLQGMYEDWEFYLHAVACGAHLELYSEPSFVYTQHDRQMTKGDRHGKGMERIYAAISNCDVPPIVNAWSIRQLRQDAYNRDNVRVWEKIDHSADSDLIKEINKPANSLDKNIQLLGEFFKKIGKSVEISRNNSNMQVMGAAAKVYLKDATSGENGFIFVATELAKTDVKKCAEYLNQKIPFAHYKSKVWCQLIHLRARCYLRGGEHQKALLDIVDSEDAADYFENIRAFYEYFSVVNNLEKKADYGKKLEELQENFYYEANPDVAHAVSRGEVSSAKVHYQLYGNREGRVWLVSRLWDHLEMNNTDSVDVTSIRRSVDAVLKTQDSSTSPLFKKVRSSDRKSKRLK
jgi:glycosyltransferase involved in cell wall biosynthesis